MTAFLGPELSALARLFWDRAGTVPPFPRDLETALQSVVIPSAVVPLSHPTVHDVYDWLRRYGVTAPHQLCSAQRAIFGCLIADRGAALIFVDGEASREEQRFTIAHECGHLLRDYLRPREKAVERLGPAILEVLDGDRPPTNAERVAAILNETPIGPYTDLMLRGPRNRLVNAATSHAEQAADALALELLAPYRDVLRFAGVQMGDRPESELRASLPDILHTTFGLPRELAAMYGARLAAYWGRRSVRDWLGL